MLRPLAALGLIAIVACGGEPVEPTPRPDAWPPSTAPLDIDAVVTWGGDPVHAWLSMYPREQQRECLCNAEWPPLDECVEVHEQGECTCWPHPATCLDSIRAERDGAVIGGGSAFIPGYVSFDLPELEDDSETTELVLDGCGGSARVPLPAEPILVPQVDTIAFTDDEVLLTWTSPSPHGEVSVWCTSEGNATGCVLPATSPARIPRDELCDSISFAVVDGGDSVDTELGTVRVWRQHAINSFNAVYFPEQLDGGRRGLPTNAFSPQTSNIEANVELLVDGGGVERVAVVIEASVVLGPDVDSSLAFTALVEHRFELIAGATTDRLRVSIDGDWYAGEVAHVDPDDGIDIGHYRDELYSIDIGPVTLINESNANETAEASLAIDWNMGIVARPSNAVAPVGATSSD
jgi:hypothetical protein